MLRRLHFVAFLLLFAACISSGPPTRPNDREWNALQADYSNVQNIRRAAAPILPTDGRREQIEKLLDTQKKLEPVYTPFLEKLQEYLERTGDARAAKLLAAEKIRLGDEYMNVVARYDRALAMYQSALTIDPGNADAQAKVALAQSKRYADFNVFSTIRTGMKEDDVRRIVGMPREDWIKQVTQNSRMYSVWIYPKNDGGAAAIYFDNGIVYHTNWNAAPATATAQPGGNPQGSN